jgi:hypothetical protein
MAWRQYRAVVDPMEDNDLAQVMPELFAEMVAAHDRFAECAAELR